jgi:hypothetical protein
LSLIGDRAFAKSTLEYMQIPASITSLGNACFEGCNRLTELLFEPRSALRQIGNQAFEGCRQLRLIRAGKPVREDFLRGRVPNGCQLRPVRYPEPPEDKLPVSDDSREASESSGVTVLTFMSNGRRWQVKISEDGRKEAVSSQDMTFPLNEGPLIVNNITLCPDMSIERLIAEIRKGADDGKVEVTPSNGTTR